MSQLNMMIEFIRSLRRTMTEIRRPVDMEDCSECSGPPPIFELPPPPRPAFLDETKFCSELPIPELEDCSTFSLIGISYHNNNNPTVQNEALIIIYVIVSLFVTTTIFVASWKFFTRPWVHTFRLARVWQNLLHYCHLSTDDPAGTLIHAPLKEPNILRREFIAQQAAHHQYRSGVRHTHAAILSSQVQSDLSPESADQMYNACRRSILDNERDTSYEVKSSRRSQTDSEHVIMLLNVAAQLTNKRPRFL